MFNLDMTEATSLAQQEQEQTTMIAAAAGSLVISDDAEYSAASSALARVKGKRKLIDDKRKSLTGPLLKIKRDIDGLFKPLLDALSAAEAAIKNAMSVHAQRKLDEQAKVLLVAQQAARAGDRKEFAVQIRKAENTPARAPTSFTREVVRFVVTDVSLLPRDCLMADEKAIGAKVKETGEKTNIPGVRVWKDIVVVGSVGK